MKTSKYLILAAATLLMAACQEKLAETPADGSMDREEGVACGDFTLYASASPVTRTELDGENYVTWKSGDALSVWETGGSSNVKFTLDAASAGEREGAFTADFTPASDDFTVVGIYPYNAEYGNDATAVPVTIPATVDQKTSANAVIGVSDFMFGSASLKSSAEKYSMSFSHPLALIDIVVDASNSCLRTATLSSVTFESNGGAIVGDFTANLTDGTLTAGTASSKLLTVNFPSTASASSVQHAWVAINPVDLTTDGCTIVVNMTNGQQLTFAVKPKAAFEAQKIYTFNLDNLDVRVDKGQANPYYVDLVAAYKGKQSNRANCYIVREGGYYRFAAQRIDKTAVYGSSITGCKADWLWATGTESKVDHVGLGGSGNVNFRVQAQANGNTIIAVANADKEILWSWHVWCSVEDPMLPVTYSRNNAWNVSARNLGALSTADGNSDNNLLYYQYGRKDPFPANTANCIINTSSTVFDSADLTIKYANNSAVPADAVAFAAAHPTTYINSTGNNTWVKGKTMSEVQTLWNSSTDLVKGKTNYDPCPAGYSIINDSSYAWGASFVLANMTINSKGFTYTDPAGASTYYPAAGYLNTLNDLREKDTNVRVWAANVSGSDTNIQSKMLYATISSSTITTNTARTYFALPVRCMKVNE